MSQCRNVHPYADGQLPSRQHTAFGAHLPDCGRCQRELELIFALAGLAGSLQAITPSPVTGLFRAARQGKGWSGWWRPSSLFALALPALACAMVFCRPHQTEDPTAWITGERRLIEARVSDARGNVYRPFDPSRGGAPATIPDYGRLEKLQRKGDRKALASLLLVHGQNGEASALLANAPSDESVDNERAVLAFIEHRHEDALRHLEAVLARDPRSPPALWNRALALRELGLAFGAAQTWRSPEIAREPGWADEAQTAALRLTAEVQRRKQSYEGAEREALRLSREHLAPSDEAVQRHPDLVRLHFYEGLRTISSAQQLKAFEPLARQLDDHFGGHVLVDQIRKLARTDFEARAPLAARYTSFVNARWKGVPGEQLDEFARRVRKVGDQTQDLLVGTLVADGPIRVDEAELLRLADAVRDPWLQAEILEAAARKEPDVTVGGKREQLLRRAIEITNTHRLAFRRLRLQNNLGYLLLRQQRPTDAAPMILETRASARALGMWQLELRALVQLAHLASYRREATAAKAYAEELRLAGASCELQVNIQDRLAERAINDGDPAQARRMLSTRPRCSSGAQLDLPALAALSELAAANPQTADADWFKRELARTSEWARSANYSTAVNALSLAALEGRALITANRQEGKRLLRDVIEQTDKLPRTDRGMGLTRLKAYRRLISDAMVAGDLEQALTLMAAESDLDLPASCVVGLSEDLKRGSVVVRTTSGRLVGRFGHRVSADQPAEVVPADLQSGLAGCPEVAVIALSPFRGRARVLGPDHAWRHLVAGRRDLQSSWTPAYRTAVYDVVAPSSLGVPTLPPWRPPEGARIARHLHGPEAHPAAVMDALRTSDLIEFHVHGLADFNVSDGAFLVLSAGSDGEARLQAEVVRSLALPRRPFVVLAACDSAKNSPYFSSYSGRLSLPAAFLQAGARAVLAADEKIPDAAGAEVVSELIAQLERGRPAALALRDIRMDRLKKGATWVQDLVLFE